MDLAKFVALVCQSELWFSNAEVLAFDDPQEAVLPHSAFEHRGWTSTASLRPADRAFIEAEARLRSVSFEEQFEFEKRSREFFIFNAIAARKSMFVNSWHLGERESAAMWRIYAKSEYGLAITSNYSRVSRALCNVPESLYFGPVRYIESASDFVDPTNGFNVVMTKRSEFGYESEARIVYWEPEITRDLVRPLDAVQPIRFTLDTEEKKSELLNIIRAHPYPSGTAFACDLSELIEEVWISPYAPAWMEAAIHSFKEKTGLTAPIRRSNLLDDHPT